MIFCPQEEHNDSEKDMPEEKKIMDVPETIGIKAVA